MSYIEKLRDPRWQKKRLEIMNRDKFTCISCGSETKTLNVHHKIYSGDPWDVESKYLITLCEDCHKYESSRRKEAEDDLINTLKQSPFLTNDIFEISVLFHKLKIIHLPDVIISVLIWHTENFDRFQKLEDEYFEYLTNKHSNDERSR